MRRKKKGLDAERELIHLFWKHKWAAVRVAGSGSSSFPSPDILAGKGNRKLAIECKACKGIAQYFSKEEIAQLKEFTTTFGAESWVAVKFTNRGWYFVSLEDLHETPKSFALTEQTAKQQGFEFSELIKKSL